MTLPTSELVELLGRATKGPWAVTSAAGYNGHGVSCGSKRVCALNTNSPLPFDERDANAKLLAASKDLAHEVIALRKRVGELEAGLRPMAAMGRMLEGPFAPAIFPHEQSIGAGCAWTENGQPRTITFGDLRKAAALLKTDAQS